MRSIPLLLLGLALLAPIAQADTTCVADACVVQESEGACDEHGTDHAARSSTAAGWMPRNGPNAYVQAHDGCEGFATESGGWSTEHETLSVVLLDHERRYSFLNVRWSQTQHQDGTTTCATAVSGNGLFELVGERAFGCPLGGPSTLP